MPAALLLAAKGADANQTVVHSRTEDAVAECRQADVVIAAVGRPDMVKADWIKPGAVVVDGDQPWGRRHATVAGVLPVMWILKQAKSQRGYHRCQVA